MRLTTKGRFAVTAMLDLALNGGRGPVTLAGISERQGISLSYLEQLFGKLRRRKLVDSVRGPGGGYCLARPTQDITVANIVIAVDEPLDTTQCSGDHHCCQNDEPCMTHDLWSGLNETIFSYLESITLAQLIEHSEAKKNGASVVQFALRFKQLAEPSSALS
ncbi:transcriptional regulator, BadM/Rrf2 family [Formivibrio citricus]|uniref:Transcriptional regulator, BadM/Rrf2 family n=1 Tax=Formivibrio citricus TaxID=83765 RepID=A0A1I5BAD1_9NEIS|nr:Fe-S cluster assembly transcription factor [Formivibrio citricus]SFN71694.1 transcriptional regulator, BadM/Rrf2 family [Formivibrio citricus]